MLRNIGAVFAGMFVGMLANMAVIMAMVVVWPLPEGVDMADPVAFGAYAATLPVAAWLSAIAAHLLQAGIGGWVAARLGGSHPLQLALIVGTLSMVGGILNGINLSIPTWMWIEIPFYLVVSGAAGWMEQQRRAKAA